MAGPRITQNRILAVEPQLIHTDGNKNGRIACLTSRLFMVGQLVTLRDITGKQAEYQIKRIVDKFMYLGEKGKGIVSRSDLRQWLTTSGATIEAAEQERPKTPVDQTDYFEHADEPINAKRTIDVDLHGEYVDPYRWESNQMPGGKSLRSQNAAPFSHQFIPRIISKFIGDLNYDKVENLVEGDLEKVFFRLNDTIVKELHLRYKDASWMIVDPTTGQNLNGFLLQEQDGDLIMTEQGEAIEALAGVDIYGE